MRRVVFGDVDAHSHAHTYYSAQSPGNANSDLKWRSAVRRDRGSSGGGGRGGVEREGLATLSSGEC